MADGNGREPIRLKVPAGAVVKMDSERRVAIFPAVNDILVEGYELEVPLWLVKVVAGGVIQREGAHEDKARQRPVQPAKPRIMGP